jgi:hypothetical protein
MSNDKNEALLSVAKFLEKRKKEIDKESVDISIQLRNIYSLLKPEGMDPYHYEPRGMQNAGVSSIDELCNVLESTLDKPVKK